MRRALFCLFAATFAIFGPTLSVAADVESDEAANAQEGDNEGSAESAGSSQSGDAVGGQVTGVVSSGDASIDAKNRSEKADITSGPASGANTGAVFVGLDSSTSTVVEEIPSQTDVTVGTAFNVQEGDNGFSSEKTVTATSGDAVGGQVIGAVTSSGGSADIVADNASKNVAVETGEASAANFSDDFVGLDFFFSSTTLIPEMNDVTAGEAGNVQEGNNELSSEQISNAASGDGVAGQVIGAVSAGDTSIDARNRSEKVDLETGSASADNQATGFAGLDRFSFSISDESFRADVEAGEAANVQDGDNGLDRTQSADASSGDAIGGQVIGAVTAATGSADIVADNASKDVDVETGGAEAANDADDFVGLDSETVAIDIVCPGVFCSINNNDAEGETVVDNIQDGDNELASDQVVSAASGDGVAGQVVGAVSAGDTSIDARNRSEDIDLETGEAGASNTAFAFVGQRSVEVEIFIDILGGNDAVAGTASNVQDGDNALDRSQSADASSGDAVGGQVIGAVTSAGSSADIVADNASKKVDVDTGDADASNFTDDFVGLLFSSSTVAITIGGVDATVDAAVNVQDGDNELSSDQSASAATGDGVGGQVIGAVSAGDTSIDARSRSEDIDLETGVVGASNTAFAFVGQRSVSAEFFGLLLVDAVAGTASNVQDGDNALDRSQSADASSGDAVGGQVIGAVTSAGGSADIVADNASRKVELESGDSFFSNFEDVFVGLNVGDLTEFDSIA